MKNIVLVVVLCAACGASEGTGTEASAIVTAPGGWSLNGPDLNGVNSEATGGSMLAGVRPFGRMADGTAAWISLSGPPLSGKQFVGSHWTGVLANGGTVPLTVTAAGVIGGDNWLDGKSSDVWRYTFMATVGGRQVPLCTDPNWNTIGADTVRGTWNTGIGVPGGGSYDPTSALFTVACQDSSIAKCLELGYKPWLGRSAEAAACVRAMRGDYCGDGEPYTIEMTQIGIFDDLGIQWDDYWPLDAVWTPSGAACIADPVATRFALLGEVPSCIGKSVTVSTHCGSGWSGARITTELPPQ